jgi:hypothetical protein
MSGKSEERLLMQMLPRVTGVCVKPDNKPKLNKLKLICVTALINFIVLVPAQSFEEDQNKRHKYPIEEFQQRALERSPELKLLEQAVKVAESKRWTSLAPGVGIGNNFASKNNDVRFNVNWDIAEVLGGGRIRQVNLDIAQLKFRKLELESKLKMQVLENVLALERAERNVERIQKKLTMLHKRTRFINSEYENGERDFDSVMKYWEVDEDLEKSKLEMLDQVELERARLEELVGVF